MQAFQYHVLSEESVEVGVPSSRGDYFITNQYKQFPIASHSMELLADCDKVTLTITNNAKFRDFINMLCRSNFVETPLTPAT